MSTTPLPDPSNPSSGSPSLVHAPGVGLVQVPAGTPDAHVAAAVQQFADNSRGAPTLPPAPASGFAPTVVADPNQSYSLANVPQFLRDTLPMNDIKVEQGDWHAMTGVGAEHPKATAYVSPQHPLSIEVLDPKTFKQAQLDHELTHTYQDRLGPTSAFAPVNPAALYQGANDPAYIGKNAVPTAYSKEQLARMIENQEQRFEDIQQKAKAGKLTQDDVDEYQKWRSALAPVVTAFAAMGSKKQYPAAAAQPNTIYDLPEFSGRSLPIPANLPRRALMAPTADPRKVATGVF